VKAPLYSQQVDKDVGAELCNDNESEASPLALIWILFSLHMKNVELVSQNYTYN
jgi:hypothetical protein